MDNDDSTMNETEQQDHHQDDIETEQEDDYDNDTNDDNAASDSDDDDELDEDNSDASDSDDGNSDGSDSDDDEDSEGDDEEDEGSDDDDESEEDYDDEEEEMIADGTTIMAIDGDKLHKNCNVEEVDGGGEIDVCSICYVAWTSSGDHQICCLPCGHIYGMSCITKWLRRKKGSGKCPQCNSLCRLKDVRPLYTTPLCVADEEFHKVQMPLEKIRKNLKEEIREETQVTHDELRKKMQLAREVMCQERRNHVEHIEELQARIKSFQEFKVQLDKIPEDELAQFLTKLRSNSGPSTK